MYALVQFLVSQDIANKLTDKHRVTNKLRPLTDDGGSQACVQINAGGVY